MICLLSLCHVALSNSCENEQSLVSWAVFQCLSFSSLCMNWYPEWIKFYFLTTRKAFSFSTLSVSKNATSHCFRFSEVDFVSLHHPFMTLELQNAKSCTITFSSVIFFSILPKSGFYFCLHNSEKVTRAFIFLRLNSCRNGSTGTELTCRRSSTRCQSLAASKFYNLSQHLLLFSCLLVHLLRLSVFWTWCVTNTLRMLLSRMS